jgi:hypothetical protein
LTFFCKYSRGGEGQPRLEGWRGAVGMGGSRPGEMEDVGCQRTEGSKEIEGRPWRVQGIVLKTGPVSEPVR